MQKLIYILLPVFFITIYDFTLPSASGGNINLNDYKGKKILVVNTASNSENAIQYAKLEELYQKYKDSLVIIAVPSNSFGNEHDEDSVLYDHLTIAYGVTYPITTKQDVTGDNTCPLFQWIARKNLNGVLNNNVHADFQKFLIDESGHLTGVFSASVDPLSSELEEAITGIE